MTIAIIGTGNVGAALATRWAAAGHDILLGVRDTAAFKGRALLDLPRVRALSVAEASAAAEVILLAVPAPAAVDAARALGDTTGKVILDAMNAMFGRGPEGYANTADAVLDHTATTDVVKAFNFTGASNLADPAYGEDRLDAFVAGDSARGVTVARQLASDAGFGACHHVGGNDRFGAMEAFAGFWISLAMNGLGRDFGFKVLQR